MIKNKFYKNLYQTISFLVVIVIFIFFLLLGFVTSLNYENGNGWILLVISISLMSLYFIIGFYWIFQKVEINTDGIKIKIFNKIITKVNWDNIEKIELTSFMKNPAYVIITDESKKINLDCRKKIRDAIVHFGNENIKLQMQQI